MRDTKQWAAQYVERPGFEPMLQHLIGNATFEESAMRVMERLAENTYKNIDEMNREAAEKDRKINALQGLLHDKDIEAGKLQRTIADIKQHAESLVKLKSLLDSNPEFGSALRELLHTI